MWPIFTARLGRMEVEGRFRAQLRASIETKQRLMVDLGPCVAVAGALIAAYRAGNTLFIFGNGGSAADFRASRAIRTRYFDRIRLDARGSLAQVPSRPPPCPATLSELGRFFS